MNWLTFAWNHTLWYIGFSLAVVCLSAILNELTKGLLRKIDAAKTARVKAQCSCSKCGSSNTGEYRKEFSHTKRGWGGGFYGEHRVSSYLLYRKCKDCGYEKPLEGYSNARDSASLIWAIAVIFLFFWFTQLLSQGIPQQLLVEFKKIF